MLANTTGTSNQDENDKSGNNQISVPSISLPKGGGAIRGIGEKFPANPVTGTGSMTVLIATSPGRSGFSPQLSLSYDSGAGNGPFGFGWHLMLPSITRKTDKGVLQYDDAEESDMFILSGSEDLVPLLVEEHGEWQRKHTYRTLDDGTTSIIHYYRPRIEGLFACIELWTNEQTGDIHWRSISKDNITTLYGKRKDSRIADPENPLDIFSWLICESYDDKWNVIVYEYKAEDSANVDLCEVQERNRSELTRSTNRYLKRIRYGNLAPHEPGENLSRRTDMCLEAVFDYGEHDIAAPTPREDVSWPARPDAFSTYRAGFEVRTYRLCCRVLMFHHFPAEQTGRDCLVLCAVTDSYQPLIDAIKTKPLGTVQVGTVEDLAQKSAKDWEDFFSANSPGWPQNTNLLPLFTAPGTAEERVAAFIRHLRNFFKVSSTPSPSPKATVGELPALAQASGDALKAFISAYTGNSSGSGFAFSASLDSTKFQNALNTVFPGDPSAREWLAQAMQTINDLYTMTAKGMPQSGHSSQPDMEFSVIEALYARGFTNLQSIQALTSDDFQDALTGTIAYDYASTIYQNAQATGQPGGQGRQGFQPINPDGCLVNCIPPSYLSQLGPVAYLYEMLKVSEASTCEAPFPRSVDHSNGTSTLKGMIAQRRGPLDTPHVTQSNLETPLPLIDLVNECLEALAAHVPTSAVGAVYDTNRNELGGHKLCADDSDVEPGNDAAQSCHHPATLLEVLPEHSSPATLVAQPAAYDTDLCINC